MKIGIIGPEFPPAKGGEQAYAAEVARELYARDHQVVVYTRVGNCVNDEGYEVRAVLRGKQTADWQIVEDLAEMEVVHVLNAAWVWTALSGRPTFLSIHGNDFICPNPVYGFDLKDRLRLPKGDRLDSWLAMMRTRRIIRSCAPLCNGIFANSNYTKESFTRKHPRCLGRVFTAGVGIGSLFRNRPAVARRQQPITQFLTVCRLSEPRKNVDKVLRALASLKTDFRFQYKVVGEGAFKLGLTKLAGELGLGEMVSFLGEVEQSRLLCLYEEADLFVLASDASPSSFEGFGIVYLEANATGLPTMAARVGGAPEAVAEGISGFLVEEPTVDQIERGLRSFLTGERKFEAEACQRFANQFTWARVVDIFEHAYSGKLIQDTGRLSMDLEDQ